ncbi:MAG: cation diffusion facilitator family transporter, partial [Burkholderiaceae bacterium]|nr:cation diffusion facilitator family transporter [Burkholderiaceae bacterium]
MLTPDPSCSPTPSTVLSVWLTPRHLLWASVGVAMVTIALKTLAWVVSDSVGLLSDAMESFVNLASAMFALAMVTVAQRPADDDHPYGHHKAEYFSSGFEGMLIVGVSVGIFWAAGHRLMNPQAIEQVGWGLALSMASSALNGLLAWVMFGAARTHRSIALEADARHLVTDVWTSVGVVVGIVGAALTGWLWLDAVAAIVVALNILKEGVHLVWQSSQGLMDAAVEPEVQATIEA